MTILYSIIPALCLCIGFYFGFKLGKTNELPNVANIKREIKENKIREEELKDIEEINKVLGNLDRYDGSPKGQEDIV